LLVTSDGAHAVASDPDRDAVYLVDLTARQVTHTVALRAGDEPGRVVEDGAGRVHVALRSGGALVTLDGSTGAIVTRRSVCPAPRGVAWDASTDLVWVACATGELVALPAAGGSATQNMKVERDLRDVFVDAGAVSVTSFRSAEVLRLGTGGAVTRRDALSANQPGFIPHVAWRTIAASAGALVASYQQETTTSVPTQVQGGYGCPGGSLGGPAVPQSTPLDDAGDGFDAGTLFDAGGGCTGSITQSVLSVLGASGTVVATAQVAGVLPVDVALSADGKTLAVVTPGNAYAPGLFTVQRFTLTSGATPAVVAGGPDFWLDEGDGISRPPIAAAFDGTGNLLVQSREPAALFVQDPSGNVTHFPLSTISRADTGVDVFHTQAGANIACASCHPEGRDDGHVWLLDGDPRRTPSLRGTIAGTAPYHWPGDEATMDVLLTDVYQGRMDGAPLDAGQTAAIEGWVNAIPAPPAPSWVDTASATRGQSLFARADVKCATCHSGAKFTDNLTVDVGTGGAFQVPPLVGVGWRTPLLHDGCAATIADRFGACATPAHGTISGLSAQDLTDLENYLETL
jgi:cytochrome c553